MAPGQKEAGSKDREKICQVVDKTEVLDAFMSSVEKQHGRGLTTEELLTIRKHAASNYGHMELALDDPVLLLAMVSLLKICVLSLS